MTEIDDFKTLKTVKCDRSSRFRSIQDPFPKGLKVQKNGGDKNPRNKID